MEGHEDTRISLLNYLQKMIKLMLTKGLDTHLTIADLTQSINLVSDAIERILSFELSKYSSSWSVILPLQNKVDLHENLRDIIKEIKELSLSPSEKTVRFLNWTIEHRMLGHFFEILVSDINYLYEIYKPSAIFTREDDTMLFQNQIIVLDQIEFSIKKQPEPIIETSPSSPEVKKDSTKKKTPKTKTRIITIE